jgi:hypothetical protein
MQNNPRDARGCGTTNDGEWKLTEGWRTKVLTGIGIGEEERDSWMDRAIEEEVKRRSERGRMSGREKERGLALGPLLFTSHWPLCQRSPLAKAGLVVHGLRQQHRKFKRRSCPQFLLPAQPIRLAEVHDSVPPPWAHRAR